MNESGAPLESNVCGRCDTACESDDNFCRQCGLSLRVSEHLPSVRPNTLPALRQPSVPSVVARGAAVVATAKIAEFVARRVVRSVLQRGNGNSKHLPAKADKAEAVDHEPQSVISETLVMRRIHFRR